MKTKDQYIESLAAELKEWNAQIALLTAKAEKAALGVKHKCSDELEALQDKQEAASEKLKELSEASSDAFESAKQSADKIWDELRSGLAKVASKFD